MNAVDFSTVFIIVAFTKVIFFNFFFVMIKRVFLKQLEVFDFSPLLKLTFLYAVVMFIV